MTFEEIFARLSDFPPCDLIEVTGGEPMLQAQVVPFMQECLDRGFEVMMETGGSLDLSAVPREVRKIVDLKAPGSGEVARNLWDNLDVLAPWDEIKIVIADRADYEWARDVVVSRDLTAHHTVLFSPVFGELEPVELTNWVLSDALPVRVQLQIHKFIWEPDRKGV